MAVGEAVPGRVLRVACAVILPGWLLLWLYVAFLGSTADSLHLRPCSARAASSFGGRRRSLHDRYVRATCKLLVEMQYQNTANLLTAC